MHGEYNVYLGFFFWRKNPVWLISPMYHVLHQALSMVKCNKVLSVCYWWSQLDLLILDSIYKKGSHNTHLCFLQTVETTKRLEHEKGSFSWNDSSLITHKDKDFLEERSKREGISVKLAMAQESRLIYEEVEYHK